MVSHGEGGGYYYSKLSSMRISSITRWVSKKSFSEVVDRGKGFFRTSIEPAMPWGVLQPQAEGPPGSGGYHFLSNIAMEGILYFISPFLALKHVYSISDN